MPRTLNQEVRSRLISAGLKIVHEHGFNGCGVQEITAAAGIPKGSFYNYFLTKDAFAVELLESYWSSLSTAFSPILENTQLEPVARVELFFRALSREHQAQEFALGCLLGTLALELSSRSPAVRNKVSDLLERWAQPLAACLGEAQERGTLSEGLNASDLAAVLIEAWEGAAMRGKVLRSDMPYRRFESFLLRQMLK